MWQTIKQLIVNNWKTTCTGLVTGLAWLMKTIFQIDVAVETQKAFLAFMVTLAALFSKDGNVSGTGK